MLYEYLEVIRKNLWILILAVLVVTLSAFFFTKKAETSYKGVFAFFISQKKPEATTEYQYSGYYSVKAAQEMADSLYGALKVEAGSSIFSESKLDKKEKITFKKLGPAAISIHFQGKDKDRVQKLLDATDKVTRDKLSNLKPAGQDFQISTSSNYIQDITSNVPLSTGIGFVAGLVLGLFVIFFKEGYKEK